MIDTLVAARPGLSRSEIALMPGLCGSAIVVGLRAKLLMVGDSVMGCFLQAPEDGDASPGAVL